MHRPESRGAEDGTFMCGRYTLTVTVKDLQEILPALEAVEAIVPRYNIAPTQPVAVVASDAPARLVMFRWGLIPRWAKDPSIGSRMINARAETLADKPSFREALKKRRCLVLADGFYEWKRLPGTTRKQPYLIRLARGGPFAFAGLWDEWRSAEGPLRTCTIITTEPSAAVRDIHDRMPVILPAGSLQDWLAPEPRQPGELVELLGPSRRELVAVPVSTKVNSPSNDSPECIEPVEG